MKKDNFELDDDRHNKLSFKSYLRQIKESDNSADEFADIQLMQTTQIKPLLEQEGCLICFEHGEIEQFALPKDCIEQILELEKDSSFNWYLLIEEDEYKWYITRSLNDELIFECQDAESSGKFKYQDFIKRCKKR